MSEAQYIVTGGSRGIGAAIANELTQRGCTVVCLSRSGEGQFGRQVLCDMNNELEVKRAIREIGQAGPIAALINNAGVHSLAPAEEISTADFEQVMKLNATSVMVAAREVLPFMKEQSAGIIVNLGSLFDKMGVKDNLAYCASKAAVAAMTRVMAVEWAKYGVQVVNVAPGYIKTDLNREFLEREKVAAWMKTRIPTGEPAQAEQVASLIGRLVVDPIPFLTGETIYLDGGQGVQH